MNEKPIAILTDDDQYVYNHYKLNGLIIEINEEKRSMKDLYGQVYQVFHEDNMNSILGWEIKYFVFCFSKQPNRMINRNCFVELAQSRVRK